MNNLSLATLLLGLVVASAPAQGPLHPLPIGPVPPPPVSPAPVPAQTGPVTPPSKAVTAPVPAPLPPKEVVTETFDGPAALTGYPLVDLEVGYLMWWVRRPSLPIPLVTTARNPFQERPGVIGNADTILLYGDQQVPYGMQSGIRPELTLRYASDSPFSLNLGGFILFQQSKPFTAASDATGAPVLNQVALNPLPNVATGVPGPTGYLVSAPAYNDPIQGPRILQTGSITIDNTINLYGWEANAGYDFGAPEGWLFRGLLGFRSLGLRESYTETVYTRSPAPNFNLGPAGTNLVDGLTIRDRINTESDFYGPQVGARLAGRYGMFLVDVTGKVALGLTQNRVNAEGVTQGSNGLTIPAGIRVTSSNAGVHSSDNLAVVPEARFDLGLALNRNLTAKVGYTFLYVSRVIRPGDQLDAVINPDYVPSSGFYNPFTPSSPEQPALSRKLTDFWTQGINFSLEMTY